MSSGFSGKMGRTPSVDVTGDRVAAMTCSVNGFNTVAREIVALARLVPPAAYARPAVKSRVEITKYFFISKPLSTAD